MDRKRVPGGAPHPLRATIKNWALGTRGAAAPVQSKHSAAHSASQARNRRDGILRNMKIAHFDAFSGIAGDMTVAALIDAGAPAETLFAGLDSLGTGARFSVERVKRTASRRRNSTSNTSTNISIATCRTSSS
jgi:hypothetical protein